MHGSEKRFAFTSFEELLTEAKPKPFFPSLMKLAPYVADLGYLKEGEHTIRILSYGNRANAFGTVHCCDERQGWCGPNAWRTTGGAYSREYQLKPMGILKAPVLLYQVPHKE